MLLAVEIYHSEVSTACTYMTQTSLQQENWSGDQQVRYSHRVIACDLGISSLCIDRHDINGTLLLKMKKKPTLWGSVDNIMSTCSVMMPACKYAYIKPLWGKYENLPKGDSMRIN